MWGENPVVVFSLLRKQYSWKTHSYFGGSFCFYNSGHRQNDIGRLLIFRRKIILCRTFQGKYACITNTTPCSLVSPNNDSTTFQQLGRWLSLCSQRNPNCKHCGQHIIVTAGHSYVKKETHTAISVKTSNEVKETEDTSLIPELCCHFFFWELFLFFWTRLIGTIVSPKSSCSNLNDTG